MQIPYYHVDAFTGELFGGNPAGVCVLSASLTDSVMQKIAAENRHSETAFIIRRSDGDFDLRWFTPEVEDDLCGHATLASAYVLALQKHDVWPVRFHTRSDMLTVDRVQNKFEMDFPARPARPCTAPKQLLPALGLKTGQVLKSVRDYLVVVGHANEVRALAPNISALAAMDVGIGGMIVTASGDNGSDYVCRFFAPSVGIDEDPGTGSIQCTLVPYWAEQMGKQTLRGQQLSSRGAAFECRVVGDRVAIRGQARLYLHGTIEL
jgi:PhzF family phenazine biosynthesis protein